MARHRRPPALPQHLKAVVEPDLDPLEPERADAAGRQLDRQRQAVEPAADARDDGDRVVGEAEAAIRRGRAIHEQAHRGVLDRLGGRKLLIEGRGGQGADPPDDLALGPQHLAAGGQDDDVRRAAKDGLGDPRRRLHGVFAAVQHDDQVKRGEIGRERGQRRVVGQQQAETRRDGDGRGRLAGNLDEDRAVRVAPFEHLGAGQREGGLADAPRPHDRQEPRIVDAVGDRRGLDLASDRRAQVGPQSLPRPARAIDRLLFDQGDEAVASARRIGDIGVLRPAAPQCAADR